MLPVSVKAAAMKLNDYCPFPHQQPQSVWEEKPETVETAELRQVLRLVKSLGPRTIECAVCLGDTRVLMKIVIFPTRLEVLPRISGEESWAARDLESSADCLLTKDLSHWTTYRDDSEILM